MADGVAKIRIPNMDKTELATFLYDQDACLDSRVRVEGMNLRTAWARSKYGWDMYWLVRRLRLEELITFDRREISRGVDSVLQECTYLENMGEDHALADFFRSRFEVVD